MSLETKHSYKNKKFLQKEISKLDKNEIQEIFNIFCQSSDAKYSENSRGVFINLKFVSDDVIKKLIEFIQYSKTQDKIMEYENKSDTSISKAYKQSNHHADNKFTLSKDCIEKELSRLREKTPDNFTFQNFLDKLSITNIKDFQTSSVNKDKIVYPQLKHVRSKFEGVKARLLQKCRDVNKSTSCLPFIPSDELDTNQLQTYSERTGNEGSDHLGNNGTEVGNIDDQGISIINNIYNAKNKIFKRNNDSLSDKFIDKLDNKLYEELENDSDNESVNDYDNESDNEYDNEYDDDSDIELNNELNNDKINNELENKLRKGLDHELEEELEDDIYSSEYDFNEF